ncbi:MAG: glycerate kinase [Rhodospirillaceae bacterium]|nr:glycerate kinase [Rhodospirillaceae bacterium]
MYRKFLEKLMWAGIRSCQPNSCLLTKYVPSPPVGRTVVIGAGKAASAMALEVEKLWSGGSFEGVVVTREGSKVNCSQIEVIEASHPSPDSSSVKAGQRIRHAVSDLSENDLVLMLLSGGGSSLLCGLPSGISLSQKQHCMHQLLMSGASISELNCVRKHLSTIKGGQLALTIFPAMVVNLVISDVVSNDLSIIASGPTVGDQSTQSDARIILEQYDIKVSQSINRFLNNPNHETPDPLNPIFRKVENHLLATSKTALEAAYKAAKKSGFSPIILSDSYEGNTLDLARKHLDILSSVSPGSILLSGGEATVKVDGNGYGGPNTEFCLAMSLALEGKENVWGIAVDTDGVDGTAKCAGAYFSPDILSRGKSLGLDARVNLLDNNSGHFFKTLGNDIKIGHTQTNVNDFRAILVT